ncbi:golgin subfamily A member 1-like [Diaphorina citri]|uniref:Centrosomal protein of 162 kDa n=1 Tax=Diaphorina citri TaxID=121845 RepID=A0A1S4E764_DIACI|nr:golgin subfamily A member 1-like [Diaphorina citri]
MDGLGDFNIQRLNNELKQFSASNGSQVETSVVKELRAQLSEERAQLKAVSVEKEVLAKDNYDLRRQVKELEIIVKKRNTTGCLTITGQEFFPETEKIKQLESQLADKDKLIEKLTQNVNVTTEKYKANLEQLENQLKCESDKVKAESEKLRKLKAAHTKEIEEVKKATKKSNNKDDAHLLATIRGLQSELLNKEKLMAKINKELDDVKKTNRTLQKEREKILSSKNDSKHSSTQSLKNVGVPLPSPEHSAEMARLKQKIKELEDDIVTLHEKASYDMEMVKEQHCAELNAAKSSQGNVAELEGQIYTQEIIITHLKQKLVQLEALQNSHTMLKLENEKLEKLLTQANSTIAKLEQPVNPLDPGSSSQSQTVLSKIDYLEKRHEVREKTLQAIIHELLSDKKVNTQCMGDCQSKLLDKNREICYYRAEMDRILDSLRQYKQTH